MSDTKTKALNLCQVTPCDASFVMKWNNTSWFISSPSRGGNVCHELLTTAQHFWRCQRTVLRNAILCCTAQYCTALWLIVLHCTTQYRTVLWQQNKISSPVEVLWTSVRGGTTIWARKEIFFNSGGVSETTGNRQIEPGIWHLPCGGKKLKNEECSPPPPQETSNSSSIRRFPIVSLPPLPPLPLWFHFGRRPGHFILRS